MKKASCQSGGFVEDFLEWMGSREGLESMEASDCVFNALDGASVDLSERKIIWSNGKSLSIEESVERIMKSSGLGEHAILCHVIDWLQMEYVPEGIGEEQMEQFEIQIEKWLEKYVNGLSSK